MKNLLVSVSVAAILVGGYAWAGSPVTINNPANTQTAIVDSAGLHVVCDTGCVAGSGSPSAVNLVGINGSAPSLTNPIFTAYAEAGDTTGTFTNATQATAITATNADGYATALVSINGNYGTATGTFQASDDGGVTFYTMSCVRSDGTAVETGYTTLTNTNRQWFCPVSGNDSFRVQSSAVASGTVNVRISISAPPTNSAVVSGPTGTGANQVQGTAATGAAVVGNPVQAGCVYNSTLPTFLTGQIGPCQISAKGGLYLAFPNTLGNNGQTGTSGAFLDAVGNVRTLGASNFLYNGATQDQNVSISGTTTAGVGDAAVSEAPHNVALFTPAVTAGVSTLTLASAKNLYTAYLTNTDTVVHWLWIVNTTSAPVNGAFSTGIASGNVQDCVEIAAGTTGSIGGLPIPEPFSSGIYMANSTTGCGAASSTLTLSTVGSMHLLAK